MGGMVGQWLGAYAPERVQRLVLSNTHYYYPDKQFWNDRIRYVREHGLATLSRPQMDRWFTKDFLERSPQAITKVIGMFEATAREGYIACAEAIREIDFRASTPTISVPTLVIVGAKDPATPPEAGVAIQKMIRGANLVSLEAAHLSNIEQPMAYGKAVLDFMLAS
jgi:3-oxoadipate enol-lactonase